MITPMSIYAFLSAEHPALPWILLTIGVWGSIWAFRKWLPSVWATIAALAPTAGLSKVVQGLPAVLLGSLASVALTGGDYQKAWLGALCGALAPFLHEGMKAYGIPSAAVAPALSLVPKDPPQPPEV